MAGVILIGFTMIVRKLRQQQPTVSAVSTAQPESGTFREWRPSILATPVVLASKSDKTSRSIDSFYQLSVS